MKDPDVCVRLGRVEATKLIQLLYRRSANSCLHPSSRYLFATWAVSSTLSVGPSAATPTAASALDDARPHARQQQSALASRTASRTISFPVSTSFTATAAACDPTAGLHAHEPAAPVRPRAHGACAATISAWSTTGTEHRCLGQAHKRRWQRWEREGRGERRR